MSDQTRPNALALIEADLDRQQKRRRRHFVPALGMVASVIVGSFIVLETRPDLLDQPPAQFAVQIALWVLCLLIFPAIGVGLLFPGKRTRVALALGAVLATIAATTGWPLSGASLGAHADGANGCLALLLGSGALLLGVGFVSGAFVQRRRLAAVYWVGAGLTLMALNIVTWHCPESGLMHVVPSHLGGAVLLLVIAVLLGISARSRA